MALKLLPPKREKTVSSAEQSQRANRTILRRTLFLMILCGIVLHNYQPRKAASRTM